MGTDQPRRMAAPWGHPLAGTQLLSPVPVRGPRLTPPGGSGRLFPKTHADADAATSLPRPRRDAWLKPKPSKHPSGGRGAGPHCGPPVEVTARGRPSPGSHSHGQRHEEEAFSRILWFFSDCTSHARSLKMENTRCRRVGNTRPLTRRPRPRARRDAPRALVWSPAGAVCTLPLRPSPSRVGAFSFTQITFRV